MENFATKEQIAALGQQLVESSGHLVALGVAIRALLLTHPNRDQALGVVNAELMRWESVALNTALPDAMLRGFERARATLLPSDGDLQPKPQTPAQGPNLS